MILEPLAIGPGLRSLRATLLCPGSKLGEEKGKNSASTSKRKVQNGRVKKTHSAA